MLLVRHGRARHDVGLDGLAQVIGAGGPRVRGRRQPPGDDSG